MSCTKNEAMKLLDELHESGRIQHDEYNTLFDALDYMETLDERNEVLEELWGIFGDIPMDPETECMEESFIGFPIGTHREEIWHWFDVRHSKGVAHLMYG